MVFSVFSRAFSNLSGIVNFFGVFNGVFSIFKGIYQILVEL